MDIKKQVEDRKNALRIRIGNYKATHEKMDEDTQMAFLTKCRVGRDIDRLKAELFMLEKQWKL